MNTLTQEMKLVVINGQVIEQPANFTAAAGKDIGFEKAAKMVKRNIDANPDDVMAEFVGKDLLLKILAQPGVVGIRSFYGLNEMGIKQLLMVGVDGNGTNVTSYSTTNDSGQIERHKGIVSGMSPKCPPHCGDGTGSLSWFD
jgi:hypothetical protein